MCGGIGVSETGCLPAMNSLVIEIGRKEILMNEVFADGKTVVVKKD